MAINDIIITIQLCLTILVFIGLALLVIVPVIKEINEAAKPFYPYDVLRDIKGNLVKVTLDFNETTNLYSAKIKLKEDNLYVEEYSVDLDEAISRTIDEFNRLNKE